MKGATVGADNTQMCTQYSADRQVSSNSKDGVCHQTGQGVVHGKKECATCNKLKTTMIIVILIIMVKELDHYIMFIIVFLFIFLYIFLLFVVKVNIQLVDNMHFHLCTELTFAVYIII